MIISLMSLAEHLEHLGRVLQKIEDYNISLSPAEAFVSFLLVKLLDRCVSSLDLSPLEERAAVTVEKPFLIIPSALEIWLGMVGYFWSMIPSFAKIVGPLEDCKTLLLKPVLILGNLWKTFICKALVTNLSLDKLAAFETN